jgi:hypothetical protein
MILCLSINLTSSHLDHHGQQDQIMQFSQNSNVESHQVASKVQFGNILKIKLLELKPKKQDYPRALCSCVMG